MKLYADLPGRRGLQVLADLALLAWVAVWAWAGRQVYELTMALAGPGTALEGAGAGFTEQMGAAGSSVADVPLVGERLAAPFQRAAGVGTDIEAAGRDLVEAVTRLATTLGWVTALGPTVLAVALWLLARGRFVRRATAAQRFLTASQDLDLFALRALARQPMRRLAAVSEDPMGAWRRGEPATLRALAELELRDSGLRPPPGQGRGAISR
jgi:hypothetical protein